MLPWLQEASLAWQKRKAEALRKRGGGGLFGRFGSRPGDGDPARAAAAATPRERRNYEQSMAAANAARRCGSMRSCHCLATSCAQAAVIRGPHGGAAHLSGLPKAAAAWMPGLFDPQLAPAVAGCSSQAAACRLQPAGCLTLKTAPVHCARHLYFKQPANGRPCCCRWRDYQRTKRRDDAFLLPERSVSSMDEL